MTRKKKIAVGLGLLPLLLAAAFVAALNQRDMNHWFAGYLEWVFREAPAAQQPLHVMVLMVDHFEPTKPENARAWTEGYPPVASRHLDADGMHPTYSWFFPVEQFDENEPFVEAISGLCRRGFGEIEMHLHHNRDTAETLRAKIRRGIAGLQKYGAAKTVDGRTAFAFIHGNWALDNSVLVDGRDRCGVNSEISLLREEGCYADFTFPASRSPAQPEMLNCIFYATDDPREPASHRTGVPVAVGRAPRGDLMIFQGPLGFNLRDWRHRFYPAVESGCLRWNNPPMEKRLDFWLDAGIHVEGRPEWRFIKLYAHGASPATWNMLFNEEGFERLFSMIEARCNDGVNYRLHYVTAREAYNIVKAAEAGMTGDPGRYRDFVIKPYVNTVDSEAPPR